MEIAERITVEDIATELVLEYTRKHRNITVSSRLPPDKRLQLIDMARGISRDYLKLRGNKAVILVHSGIA